MTLTVEELQKAFNAHTNVRWHKDGRVEVRCNKGLWGVSAPDERQALVEAIRYFIQYHADGEYET